MTYYNMTNMTTSTNLLAITQQVNIQSGYILGFLIILSLFIIMFIAFKNFGVRTIMPITFFICTIISLFLAILGLIPDLLVYILIVITAGLTIASIWINPEG